MTQDSIRERGAVPAANRKRFRAREIRCLPSKDYFDHFAFQSITTAQSLEYLRSHLLEPRAQAAEKSTGYESNRIDEWVYQARDCRRPRKSPSSEAFQPVDLAIAEWLRGRTNRHCGMEHTGMAVISCADCRETPASHKCDARFELATDEIRQ